LVQDLGKISYDAALLRQNQLLQELIDIKKDNRLRDGSKKVAPVHYFLFCEHQPVYTIGRTGKEAHLLVNDQQLASAKIDYRKTNRGGDITYHGPGQIVGYPIFDLEYFFTDVHRYVRYIEEVIIRTLTHYGLQATREKGFTGVWLPAKGRLPFRKICAIGIHLSRWVSMHGFALNVNTDLTYFDKIIPCGISPGDKSVTSLAKEIGHEVDQKEAMTLIIQNFADLFEFDFNWADTPADAKR
jgi:lipoyl(octanoyl) transferase